MKKICLFLLCLGIFPLFNLKVYATINENNTDNNNVNTLDLAKNATSAIMIEESTGEIIFKKNADNCSRFA